jgi:hypothetical protein
VVLSGEASERIASRASSAYGTPAIAALLPSGAWRWRGIRFSSTDLCFASIAAGIYTSWGILTGSSPKIQNGSSTSGMFSRAFQTIAKKRSLSANSWKIFSQRRANRKIKKLDAVKDTKSEATPQAVERHFFYVTNGQTNIGFVKQIGEIYKALDSDEQQIGSFDALKAAADAVNAAYGARQ